MSSKHTSENKRKASSGSLFDEIGAGSTEGGGDTRLVANRTSNSKKNSILHNNKEAALPRKKKKVSSKTKKPSSSKRKAKYKKRGSWCDDESSESEEETKEASCSPQILKRGLYIRDELEFSVEPIMHLFECSICKGFFREPYTINKECMHTFCKSCLFLAIAKQQQAIESSSTNAASLSSSAGWCPQCQDYLGNDWKKHATPDNALASLMDKVMFKDMAEADDDMEAEFYRLRGIKRKPEKFQEKQVHESRRKKEPASTLGLSGPSKNVPTKPVGPKTEHVRLVPLSEPPAGEKDDQEPPPSLEKPFLEVPSNMRILQIKKYLALKTPQGSLRGDIFCNKGALGKEWTIEFVKRTIWTPSSDEDAASQVLTLEYR